MDQQVSSQSAHEAEHGWLIRPFAPAMGRVRDWGWRRAAYWQWMHLLKRMFGLHVHHVKVGGDRDDLKSSEPPDVPPGYVTKVGCKADFLPFVGKVPGLDAEFVDQAFARNDECTLTLYEGQLVNFCFCSRDRTRVTPQLAVLIPKGFRYVYKDWTDPAHRRKNISRMGGFVRRNRLNRPWRERSLSYVETHNYASSLHSYRHPSERGIRMGYVGWFNLFGYHLPFSSRRAKWIGFEFVRREDERRRQYVS
jgi:hypothetical protein